MKSAYLFLAAVAMCNFTASQAQNIPSEVDLEERPTLREILQRAEGVLVRSIMRKLEEEDEDNGKHCLFLTNRI